MTRNLPSLRGMRAFEAAARHLSFTKAAEELNVTHAAISHQIRALEAELKVPLFIRHPRGVTMTTAGERYLPALRQAFDLLAKASAELVDQLRHRPLTVSLTQGIAARWVMPRLHRFRLAHPEIALALRPEERLVDLHAEDVDVALRYGDGNWPNLRVEPFLRMEMFPVCSPRLAESGHPLRRPEDLRHHTLIRAARDLDWDRWLAAAGVIGIEADTGLRFSDISLTLPAALDGLGVAMGYSGFVEAELAAGYLVRPFDLVLPARVPYYIVCTEAKAGDPRIAALRAWLNAEAAGSA
ncbi:MAG TPA: transcriptional regulator GcvA [Alphaproteobacteria bacterium]|nr:transcriptional regulator GcvA [Alphaproteobacteria bacterium]